MKALTFSSDSGFSDHVDHPHDGPSAAASPGGGAVRYGQSEVVEEDFGSGHANTDGDATAEEGKSEDSGSDQERDDDDRGNRRGKKDKKVGLRYLRRSPFVRIHDGFTFCVL